MTKPEKNEIVDIVRDELKKFVNDSLDDDIKNALQKSTSKSRKELIQTIKDSLEAAFKVLWIKRDFWKTDIR